MTVSRRGFLGGLAAAPLSCRMVSDWRDVIADPTLNRHLSCEYHNGWKLV